MKIPDTKTWNVLRWIFFFPVAAIVYLIIFGSGIQLTLLIARNISFEGKTICMAIIFGLLLVLASFVFTRISVMIVPFHKKKISIMLLLLPISFNLWWLISVRELYYNHPFYAYDFYYHYQSIPEFIGSIVGGILSILFITKRNS